MTVHFTPSAAADWIVVAGQSRIIAIDPATDAATVAQAGAELDGATGFQSVLDLMLKAGITTAPHFALLDWSDGALRAIVRGTVRISVSTADGGRELSGENVTTWAEQSFPGFTGFSVVVPGGTWTSGAVVPSVAVAVAVAAPAPASASAPVPPAASAPAAPPPPRRAAAQPKPVADIEATIVPSRDPGDAQEPAADGYDYLFGETVVRSVGDAAVSEPSDDEGARDADGDHDGHTVLTSDLAKLRRGRKQPVAASAPPAAAPKLSIGLPDGSFEALDQPILIGRAPSATQVPGGKLPRLVTIGGDDPDISRTHVRIADEGGTAVVTDLHSRNGTLITLPGKSPQKLRDGEPTSVIPGTVIDLGGGITLSVREDS